MDSNHGPLVLEATALPTEPQPLHCTCLPQLHADSQQMGLNSINPSIDQDVCGLPFFISRCLSSNPHLLHSKSRKKYTAQVFTINADKQTCFVDGEKIFSFIKRCGW